MKKLLCIIGFFLVFLFGVFLRFYNLDSIPNSLDWDEAALGYNAYAILLTGRDEYGYVMPATFRSFGDYKAPLYIYLTVPSIKVFGLTQFAVRFPSAFFGSLTILAVFSFVWELFKKEKHALLLAFFSMLFFAISPWSIQFSRGAFEANVSLFFVTTGGWLLVKGVNRNKKMILLLGIVSFLLSIYTYQTEKIFVPLLLLGFLIWQRKYALQHKHFIALVIVFFLASNALWLFSGNATARGVSLTFTSQQTTLLQHSVQELQQDKVNGDIFGQILENRRVVYAGVFLQNYLTHFDPNWLFITGDLARHHAPGMGDLYLVSLPFLLIGIFIFLEKYLKKAWIILYWFLISPIPSALVIGSPHALRTLVFLPVWQIFEAIGWVSIISLENFKRIFVFNLAGVLLFINFAYYCNMYFVHINTDDGPDWQYGYEQAVQEAYQINKNNKTVFMDNSIEQGYIFYLFYNKIDPQWYQAQGGSWLTTKKCFNIQHVYFGACGKAAKAILITAQQQDQKTLTKLQTIFYHNGEPALYIYQSE
ncbi:MAG TPA: glycosyltransferase family 39 protein [Patescibacteria group bacterium]|nr:glycosyltransferase family 39 protein [Patescibacteria group bacterium]